MMINQNTQPVDDDQLIDRLSELTGDELLERYSLVAGDDGLSFAADPAPNAAMLIADSLYYIGRTLMHYGPPDYFFSDDDTDYLNAARDQLNRLTDLRIADSDDEMIQGLLDTLNYERNEENPNYDHEGFIRGYCDHFTPISALMLANTDEAN